MAYKNSGWIAAATLDLRNTDISRKTAKNGVGRSGVKNFSYCVNDGPSGHFVHTTPYEVKKISYVTHVIKFSELAA